MKGKDGAANVRIYDEDGTFDEGEVRTIQFIGDDGFELTVDFFDWVEVFRKDQLKMAYPENMVSVLVPTSRGTIIKDYRK